jgi:hypothetical protein
VAAFGKSFDLGGAVVNKVRSAGNFRDAARTRSPPEEAEHCVAPTVFYLTERQDRMGNNEKSDRKPADSKRDKEAERRAQDKALDKALEDSFPASDPIAPSQPTPKLD